jgi:hypothetical protein
LSSLDFFWFNNTDLCEPTDPAFQSWIQSISNVQSTGCTNVATQEVATIPRDFALDQNYPNPFNPTTTIAFSLPTTQRVSLKVYDALSREVATLVDNVQPAGWHEVVFDATDLPSGVYLYRLHTDSFTSAKKLILLK